jgi:hypothetical protein
MSTATHGHILQTQYLFTFSLTSLEMAGWKNWSTSHRLSSHMAGGLLSTAGTSTSASRPSLSTVNRLLSVPGGMKNYEERRWRVKDALPVGPVVSSPLSSDISVPITNELEDDDIVSFFFTTVMAVSQVDTTIKHSTYVTSTVSVDCPIQCRRCCQCW